MTPKVVSRRSFLVVGASASAGLVGAAAGVLSPGPALAAGLVDWPYHPSTLLSYEEGGRFGPRPWVPANPFHNGVDFRQPYWTPIYACAPGTVTQAGPSGDLGHYVRVDHGAGLSTGYAHMQYGQIQVTSGQTVQRGQLLGYVGDTGLTFGPHLHWETWKNGVRIDPEQFIAIHGTGYVVNGGPAPGNNAARNAVTAILTPSGLIALYCVRWDGRVWGANQVTPGGSFTAWTPIGSGRPDLDGTPTVVQLSSGLLAIYARTATGRIVGCAQSSPGGSFGAWTTIGVAGGGMASDPAVVEFSNGLIGIYGSTDSGVIAGTAQSTPGGTFGSWVQIGGSSARLTRAPAIVRFPDDRMAMYALSSDAEIWGAGQGSPGSSFSTWSPMGIGGAGVTSGPRAFIHSGRIRLFATAGATLSTVSQATVGGAFSSWVNLGRGAAAAPAAEPGIVKTASGYSAFMLGEDRNIWGTSVPPDPASANAWVQIGSGIPITSSASVLDVDGITAVYALNAAGTVVGTNQSGRGGGYGAWTALS